MPGHKDQTVFPKRPSGIGPFELTDVIESFFPIK